MEVAGLGFGLFFLIFGGLWVAAVVGWIIAIPPPPGWYPEPGASGLRWWDGFRWTDARHGVAPQVNPPA